MKARVLRRRERIPLTGAAQRCGDDDERRADRQDDGHRARPPGPLDDDAVQQAGVVERRTRDGDRRDPKERPHA